MRMLTLLCVALTVPTVFSAPPKKEYFLFESSDGPPQLAVPIPIIGKQQQQKQLVEQAKSEDNDEKFKAVTEIRQMLENSRENNTDKQLIDEFVSAGVMDSLADCLSYDNRSRCELIRNAMGALAIIAPRKAEEILELHNLIDFLIYLLRNWSHNKDKENAASILRNIAHKLVNKAKSDDTDDKLEAVTKIREMLENSLKNYAMKDLSDEFISAGVLDLLVHYLSEDVSQPQLFENAMGALAIIAPQKAENIYNAKNNTEYLNFWLMNSADDKQLKNSAAFILKNIMSKLVEQAKSKAKDVKLEAVTKIRKALEDSQKHNTDERLIDEFVSSGVLAPLVECLSEDNASQPQLVENAMAALAIIAPRKAIDIFRIPPFYTVVYLKNWLKNTTDDQLLKNAASILKNIIANDCVHGLDYRVFSNLFDSRNTEVFEQAMWGAYHLIS
ncbi:hypothetical protein niasHT_028889 [Heterodera trifolii]|uniref:Uncharacterized protein n=1 Tax=Heterodera trifolii TaxID=157864 RepID=A0ABD2KJP8_9BILA